jgi:hypothetical protein
LLGHRRIDFIRPVLAFQDQVTPDGSPTALPLEWRVTGCEVDQVSGTRDARRPRATAPESPPPAQLAASTVHRSHPAFPRTSPDHVKNVADAVDVFG